MTAGPLLALIVVAVIFIFGPKNLSKKSAEEIPVLV